MFKVILWDLDNTLLDFDYAQENSLKHVFERFNLGECTGAMIDSFIEINARHWEMLENGEITRKQVFTKRFEEFLKLYDLRKKVTPREINKEYENGICHTISFIDGSYEILNRTKHDYALYCITNGDTDVQRQRIRVSMLYKVFRDVFISEKIGYDKPRKEFFDYVTNHIIPCERDEILVIGDSLTSDMQGANNAELKCCWFNPKGNPKPDNLKIDYEIKSLDEVREILV